MARKKGKSFGQGKRAGFQREEIVFENEKFESYYAVQNLFAHKESPEQEYKLLIEFMKKQLPTTFRISGFRKHAVELKKHFEKYYVPDLQNVTYEGQNIPPPQVLSWYPDDLAYMIDARKETIRKSPPLKRLQRFLVCETEAGNISRQEAVSMLPPLFLDFEPHHVVLDMCAAPGSKTAQLIEAIYKDPKRAQMLVHQINRLNSPNVLVINHDASQMPNIYVEKKEAADGEKEILKFDRILADVPCSGDGTFRKNLMLWKEWSQSSALTLHNLQLKILMRGLQMLKVGGVLAYSTCSMNPIENESVVAAALKSCGGSVQLLDVSDKMPELLREPGLCNWKVMDEQLKQYAEYNDDAKAAKLCPTMWPLPINEMKEYHMERCVRLYPQLQNTGGFFIALLQKTEVLGREPSTASPSSDKKRAVSEDSENASETKRAKTAENNTSLVPKKTIAGNTYFDEEPFTYIKPDYEELDKIMNHYGIDSSFPRDQFFVRNQTGIPVRSIYFACKLFKNVIESNINRVKFVHGGVRFFVKQDVSNTLKNSAAEIQTDVCNFRIHSDAVNIIYPYLNGRHIYDASVEDLRTLIDNDYPHLAQFPENGTLSKKFEGMSYGCNIVRVEASESVGCQINMQILCPIWRSPSSCNLMLARKEKENLALELFGKLK
ncbi:tRNA (cytosine-5-)-methyltransferase [Schizosaccharomyces japonicus yFS275]|uniref:tRNA (Cytosine-5-)-methyltransferase n=1 Tax=Schizosaccharomyces japonicus (strain yFS275 / FY16936) TaxID=402676 RepID=B6JZQ4_SCHJY|nr:tRNA (cytosine-5-)-methyltransferase [Schizosaccharomyces japonicus yFS275]EEB07022.2 tRNA (cytosine-5-)-methyltransferase [Schizosaccharomyces japonicus yFS275]